MEWKGEAKRATADDFKAAAESIDVPLPALRAVIDVETSGSGFLSDGRQNILFEPHVFYRELGPSIKRDHAVDQGLAYQHWGEKPYPHSYNAVWDEFLKAYAIGGTAAIRSTSWGLGQIMGSEYREAGFDSPEDMVMSFNQSERSQLVGMCNLIKARGLDRDMRFFPNPANCQHFARVYNGAGYAKNRYDSKLADAFVKHMGKG